MSTTPLNHSQHLVTCIALGVVVIAGHGASWLWPGLGWPAWLAHFALIGFGVQLTPRTAFWGGWLLGAGVNAVGFYWAPAALASCLDATPWQCALLFLALVTWESLSFAFFCGCLSWLTQRGVAGYWFAPAAWVAAEFWWPKIFPWTLAHAQLELLPLIQIADCTGSAGVSFTMTSIALVPTLLVLWRWQPLLHDPIRHLLLAIGVWSFLVFGYGAWQLSEEADRDAAAQPYRIAALQVDTSVSEAEQTLLRRSLELAPDHDLICWPEWSIGTYSRELNHFRDPVRTQANSIQSQAMLRPTLGLTCDALVGGKAYREPANEDGPFTMTAYLIAPQETILARYHKRSLMPFGEYMPGEHYFPQLREWATLVEIMEPGESAAPLTASNGAKLGVVICYEDILARNARESVLEGAEILISLVNDYKFENPLTLIQHERLAALRAVENRRYLVRCAGTGVTCVISPTGKQLAALAVNKEDSLSHTVKRRTEITLYTRYGDWFAYLCTAWLVVGCLRLRNPLLHGTQQPGE